MRVSNVRTERPMASRRGFSFCKGLFYLKDHEWKAQLTMATCWEVRKYQSEGIGIGQPVSKPFTTERAALEVMRDLNSQAMGDGSSYRIEKVQCPPKPRARSGKRKYGNSKT